MRDREEAPLPRVQIVLAVGVKRGEHAVPRRARRADLLTDRRHDGDGLRRTQRAVDKILLHVHNQQNPSLVVHKPLLPLSG